MKYLDILTIQFLAEALEKWDVRFIERLFPRILDIIIEIDKRFD